MAKDTHFFIVASRGLTATTWLARSLNQHPSIFCCHGRDRPERGPETEDLLQHKAYRDDRLRYEQFQRRMSLPGYFDSLKRASQGLSVVGNVHGFIISELIDKLSDAGHYGSIPIATMFRNPFTFLDSYTALVCHRKHDYPEKFATEHLPRAKANATLLSELGKFDVDRHLDIFGFTEACHARAKMIEELRYKDVPIILMERLVTDVAYFRSIAHHLTGGRCYFDDALIEQIFRQDRLNSHRAKLKSKSLGTPVSIADKNYELWKSWPDIRKHIFHHFFNQERLDQLTHIGYDVSFV